MAELFDLRPDQQRWRVAVEKVLRGGVGLRLLVPDRHHAKVLRFVNETNMRGRLALHHVRTSATGTQPEPNTLAGKLFLVNPDHPCAAEALDVIAAAGDHICVDTPDVFARFRRAVTTRVCTRTPIGCRSRMTGARSNRPSSSTRAISAPSWRRCTPNWPRRRRPSRGARKAADDIAAQRQQWRDRAGACKAIYEQFPQWSQIDIDTADVHADRLRDQYELLLADHPDIEALSARAEECWADIQALMTKRGGAIQTRRDDLDGRRTRLMDLADRLSPGGGVRAGNRSVAPVRGRGARHPGIAQPPRAAS